MDLYIYYRVAAGNVQLLQARVAAMQAELRRQTGVAGRHQRRPAEDNGLITFMEIYPAVPDGFDQALQNAAGQSALTTLIDGARHVESFVDVAPCA